MKRALMLCNDKEEESGKTKIRHIPEWWNGQLPITTGALLEGWDTLSAFQDFRTKK